MTLIRKTGKTVETTTSFAVEDAEPLNRGGGFAIQPDVVELVIRTDDDEEEYTDVQVDVRGYRFLASGQVSSKSREGHRFYGDRNGLRVYGDLANMNPPVWLAQLVARELQS